MNKLTRQEALATGNPRYFTGKPCPYGHLVERYVKTWQCVECAAIYSVVRRKTHPTESAQIAKGWRQRNPEHARALKSASQKRNRSTANARNRKYYEAHTDERKAYGATWAKANPGKVMAKAIRRRAAKLQRTPKWADQEKIQKVYDLCARFRSLGCDFEVDHVIPLQGRNVCGLHVHNNLEIITAEANRSKANHLFERA